MIWASGSTGATGAVPTNQPRADSAATGAHHCRHRTRLGRAKGMGTEVAFTLLDSAGDNPE